MTTVAQVVARARQHVMTGSRDTLNKLSGAITNVATTATLLYDLNQAVQGARLAVDLEEMYVWSVSGTTAGSSATLERGFGGSTAASHADGALVYVNPKVSAFELFSAVNEELADLSSPANGLYQMKSVELTYSAEIAGYDLTSVTGLIDIWRVRYRETGASMDWPVLPRSTWRFDPAMDTTDFASAKALVLYEGGQPGLEVRVSYRAPFAAVTALTDDVEAVSGLHAQAHDILSLGAAIRCLSGREVKRNFTEAQSDTRRAQEVPPGAALGSIRNLAILHQQRVLAEASRLAASYPRSL